MSVFIGSAYSKFKGGHPLTKRVAEVNELISEVKRKGLYVIDNSSTWESPMVYNQIKLTNGVLYISYTEYPNGFGSKAIKRTERVGTKNYSSEPRETLTYIARMHRRALNQDK